MNRIITIIAAFIIIVAVVLLGYTAFSLVRQSAPEAQVTTATAEQIAVATAVSEPTTAPTDTAPAVEVAPTEPVATQPVPPTPTIPPATLPPIMIEPTETPIPSPTVVATRVASPDIIKIAVQAPLSGDYIASGTGVRNGVDLAIAQQSRALTNLGFRVELAAFDDQGTSEAANGTAAEAVQDPDVLCGVGHYNSGVTLSAYENVYENKETGSSQLVLISPANTNPAVTDDTDGVWRVVGRDDVQALIASEFARNQLKATSIYAVHDGRSYGRALATLLASDAQAYGVNVVVTGYDASQATIDYSPIIDAILRDTPDVVYFTGAAVRGGEFFKAARERGVAAQFLGSDSLDQISMLEIGGPAVFGTHYTTVAAPKKIYMQADQFAQDYQARFNTEPPAFSLESYDAATMCIDAIAQAARASNQQKPDRAAVLTAMRNLPPFKGISGNYRFNANGDPLSARYFVVQVNGPMWADNSIVEDKLAAPPNVP